MKIEKNKLKEALEIVKPGLASKEMIEQSTSFCFLGNKVVTYNDEISISHPIDLDLTGAVNAAELYAFVMKAKETELDLTVTDNEILIKSGRSRAGLKLQFEIKLPLEEIGQIKKWKKLPEDFAVGLKFAMGAASRDMSSPLLTCVQCKENTLIGCDNFRIAKFELSEKIPVQEFLLPADTATKVTKLLPGEIALSEGWVHFKTNTGTILSCRIFEDQYPDIEKYLKGEGKGLTFPKNTNEILERAGVFAKRDHTLDEMIEISINKGRFQIKAESETGWFKETEKVDYKEEIQFKITPYLLRDILNETLNGVIMENKLLFSSGNWKYMTLLK